MGTRMAWILMDLHGFFKSVLIRRTRPIRVAIIFLLTLNTLFAQVDPLTYKPTSLVNDFAGVFTPAQEASLERQLVDFNDSTTNVIAVVTVNDMNGYPSWQLAYDILDRWGVQHKDDGNGIVILIKPRNETAGDVAISVGYSLEAVIPDILAKRIIDEQMIPDLKEERYYDAVTAAIDVMLPLIADEIAHEREYNAIGIIVAFMLFFAIIIGIVILIDKKGGKPGSSGGKSGNGGFWRALWLASMANGGSSSGGHHGGFGGGGFGGFGSRGGGGGGGASGRF
ncbi:MAG: TPM domain-containing protein [Bacteroidales bacterium]|nr:TPM domain-containing protein [Bacteroidales bacterium]